MKKTIQYVLYIYLLIIISVSTYAEVYFLEHNGGGFGVEFYENDKVNEINGHKVSENWVLCVTLDEEPSTNAKVSSTYGKIDEDDLRKEVDDNSYAGIAVIRNEDLVVVVCPLSELKLETYVIYPKQKTGFFTRSLAFSGMPILKTLYPNSKDKIPYGQSEIFPLRFLNK